MNESAESLIEKGIMFSACCDHQGRLDWAWCLQHSHIPENSQNMKYHEIKLKNNVKESSFQSSLFYIYIVLRKMNKQDKPKVISVPTNIYNIKGISFCPSCRLYSVNMLFFSQVFCSTKEPVGGGCSCCVCSN